MLVWTVVQTQAARHARGRITALVTLALFGPAPLGFAVAGVLAEGLGPRAVIVLGGACVALAGLLGVSRRAMREADLPAS